MRTHAFNAIYIHVCVISWYSNVFSSLATSFLHLPWGQRNRRGKLCQSHLGGLSCHTCTRGRADLFKHTSTNKSTNHSPWYLQDSTLPLNLTEIRGERWPSWWRSRNEESLPTCLHFPFAIYLMGRWGRDGVKLVHWFGGGSHTIWNDLKYLYAKTSLFG